MRLKPMCQAWQCCVQTTTTTTTTTAIQTQNNNAIKKIKEQKQKTFDIKLEKHS